MPKREEKRKVRRAEDEDESERTKIYLAASVMNGWTRGDLLGAESVQKKGPCYVRSPTRNSIPHDVMSSCNGRTLQRPANGRH